MQDLAARVRIDFGPERALGPGKVALLETLDRAGSLSAAARALGMSYRRAWLLVRSLNALFDRPLVVLSKGGRGGGGARVTREGRGAAAAFRRVEARAGAHAVREFGAFGRPASQRRGGVARVRPLAKASAKAPAKAPATTPATTRAKARANTPARTPRAPSRGRPSSRPRERDAR